MTQYRILVSSYTDYISTLIFDKEKKSVSVASRVQIGHHPSWITPHPTDKSIVFTGLEQFDGIVVALKVHEEGRVEVVEKTSSGGRDPCHLVATKEELLIANYSSGILATLPLKNGVPYLSSQHSTSNSSLRKAQMIGDGPNKGRQEGSHPHHVVLIPEYEELLVPDLGADKVWRFKKGSNGAWTVRGHVQYELGGGPRHTVFHNGELFTVLELSNKVARHTFPPFPQLPKHIITTPTMSSPPPLPNDMLAAEILINEPSDTFPTTYLYVSNRNDPSPEGDIISIFDFTSDKTKLVLINEVRTGLKHVRGMILFGDDEKFLIVGGANDGGVKVYERIHSGKDLIEVASDKSVEAPTGFLVV